MKGEKIFKNKIFPLSVYKENRAVFPFCRKIWWQSSKTFQKVNYVTCSVVWKYKLGGICTKKLQIQRKICFKVNNFFYRSFKKGNVVSIIFFIQIKDSNELSIAAHFVHCHLTSVLKDTSLHLSRSVSSFLIPLIFTLHFRRNCTSSVFFFKVRKSSSVALESTSINFIFFSHLLFIQSIY
jgi:hypothetical protein